MRPRRRLRVILHRQHRQPGMSETLQRLVVQIDVRRHHVAGQCGRIDRESVVLRRDLHPAGPLIPHRVVRPPMPVFQLERLRPERLAQQLNPEADPENRRAVLGGGPLDQLPERRHRPADRRGVARPVRHEDAVGLALKHLVGRRGARQDRHLAAGRGQASGDVPLHPEIERHHMRPIALPPGARARGHHLAGQIPADQPRALPGQRDQPIVVQLRCRQDPLHRPPLAGPAHERPRVDALDADDAVFIHVIVERPRRPVVAGPGGQLADDEAGDPGAGALGVLGVDADVADLRAGHGDDLAAVRGVGEDLLVPGHARVEHDLARGLPPGPERGPGQHGAVFQGELGDVHRRSIPK